MAYLPMTMYLYSLIDAAKNISGWAATLVGKERHKETDGVLLSTTPDQTRILATASAVKLLVRPCDIILITNTWSSAEELRSLLDTPVQEWPEVALTPGQYRTEPSSLTLRPLLRPHRILRVEGYPEVRRTADSVERAEPALDPAQRAAYMASMTFAIAKLKHYVASP